MYKEKIDAFIEENKDILIEDICGLIRIPSVVNGSQGELPYGRYSAEALDYVLRRAQEMGFETKNLDYRMGYAAYGPEPRKVDIVSHVDVVKADEGWTITDPFNPCVKDGKIYGRGAADDKGPTIAALYALYVVKQLGIPLKRGVRVVMGCNEENGTREDLRHYISSENAAEISISPDADYPVINVEKGSLRGRVTAEFEQEDKLPRIRTIDGGKLRYEIPGVAKASVKGMTVEELAPFILGAKRDNDISITVEKEDDDILFLQAQGRKTHVGAMDLGNNAITGMIDFLLSLPLAQCTGVDRLRGLQEVFPHGDNKGTAAGIARSTKDSGDLSCTFNIFHYTEQGFTGSFDSKTPLGCTEENTKKVMVSSLENRGITVQECELKPVHYVPLDGELVQTLLSLYTEYTGLEGYGVTIDGTTYLHGMKNAVAFGCAMPGVDNHMHMGNEFADIDVLLMSVKIYARAIIEFCA